MPPGNRWFHSSLSGIQAERLLKEHGQVGSFLVRPSTTSVEDYTLSVLRKPDHVTHIRIHNSGDCYDLFGGEKFATLKELIQYFTEEGGLTEKNGEVIKLSYPVNSVDPTAERWFHGSITGPEAERYLMDNTRSKVGSFLVRESKSAPGNYVLTVRCEDKVTHVRIRHQNDKFDLGGGQDFDTLSELVDFYKKSVMVEVTGTVILLKAPFNATKINAISINSRVDKLNKESEGKEHKPGFWEEFEQLASSDTKETLPRTEGAKSENKPKNRFKNILPFDHTRVKLKDGSPHVAGSDYINANYIKDEEEEGRVYIATQGCLPSTVDDFWRMIAQEETRVIVMVTKEIERGKTKCIVYWPANVKESKKIDSPRGRITVTLESVEDDNDWKLRVLNIKLDLEDKKKQWTVYQYHFLKWPDHGAPSDPGAILQLLHAVSQKQDEEKDAGPIVVHCSAGIGRTGTFIAIDILISQIKRKGLACEIDIQKTIQGLRTQRSGMVQAEAQYKFVYLAVKHFIETETAREQERRRVSGTHDYTNITCSDDLKKAAKARGDSIDELADNAASIKVSRGGSDSGHDS